MGDRIDDGLLAKMTSSIEKYKADLEKLVAKGDSLFNSMQYECYPEQFLAEVKKMLGNKTDEIEKTIKAILSFKNEYQSWYSEAQSLIKQLLPNRYNDFVSLYEKPKNRKEVQYGNYVIADYLQGLRVTYLGDLKVDPTAAIPQLQQQLNMLKAVRARFDSSLFDIKQLVQADLFDSELDAARELLKNKFGRAAGAVAGVVLERHLQQVCENHNVSITKKNPTIATLNDALKDAGVIDTPQWRFVQHLGDIRNLCDHNKSTDPTPDQITDLITGVEKTAKTLF